MRFLTGKTIVAKEPKVRRMITTDNKGYSLVELIVSILIMSVLTGMIVMLISSSRATYNEVNRDAVIQGETELIRNYIGEIALEAFSCGSFGDPDGTDDNCIWLLAPDNKGETTDRYYYFFLHEKANHVIRYGRYKQKVGAVYNPDLTGTDGSLFGPGFNYLTLLEDESKATAIKGDDYKLLAEYVDRISLSSDPATGLITVTVKMNYDGVGVTRNIVLLGRNTKSASLH